MDDLITQVGVGGLIAILLVREVLGFLKSRKTKEDAGPEVPPLWAETLVARVKQMYFSHDKLQLAFQRLVDSSEKQTLILEKLACKLNKDGEHG